MLLPWRSHLAIYLTPSKVIVAQRQTSAGDPDATAVTDLPGEEEAYFAGLQAFLSDRIKQKSAVSVVLADSLLHYAILPWSKDITTSVERENHARLVLESVYGHISHNWKVCLTDARALQPSVIGGVSAVWLDGLMRTLQILDLKVKAVQPKLLVAYQARKKEIPNSTLWFATYDQESLAALHITNGKCDGVRAVRVGGDVDRELMRLRLLGQHAKRLQGTGEVYVDGGVGDSMIAEREGLFWLGRPSIGSNVKLRAMYNGGRTAQEARYASTHD